MVETLWPKVNSDKYLFRKVILPSVVMNGNLSNFNFNGKTLKSYANAHIKLPTNTRQES